MSVMYIYYCNVLCIYVLEFNKQFTQRFGSEFLSRLLKQCACKSSKHQPIGTVSASIHKPIGTDIVVSANSSFIARIQAGPNSLFWRYFNSLRRALTDSADTAGVGKVL